MQNNPLKVIKVKVEDKIDCNTKHENQIYSVQE